jgi:hypothetical protein
MIRITRNGVRPFDFLSLHVVAAALSGQSRSPGLDEWVRT